MVDHGPEFVAEERPACLPHNSPAVKHVAGRAEFDDDGQNEKERKKRDQKHARAQHIDEALDRLTENASPIRRKNGTGIVGCVGHDAAARISNSRSRRRRMLSFSNAESAYSRAFLPSFSRKAASSASRSIAPAIAAASPGSTAIPLSLTASAS